MKIIFCGGGSGGHIFPIIAITREMKKLAKKKIKFYYLGPKDSFGKLLSKEGIVPLYVFSGKLRRYITPISLIQNTIDIFIKIPLGILQSFLYIFLLAPDLIFSKGGYGSFPAVIAGKILGVPIFLHESDSVPGLANRILANFALEIFVSFPDTPHFPKEKIIVVGNPIREEILTGSREEARQFFNITGEKPVILILGGSQGAQRINDKVLEILPQLLIHFEVIHQCGERNYKSVKNEANIVLVDKSLQKYYHLFPFLEENELKLAYAISDLIVSRAGAGVIFEIAALGKPSVLIPLPEAAQEHQVRNAYLYQKAGATMVIEQESFTSHFFLATLKNLFDQKEKLERMQINAKNFSRPKAAQIIAYYLLEYLKEV